MARAVAGEAGVPFFSISGSEFVEMFVGVGASRVRDLFDQAKRNSPCIVFVDEIDAVGRQRGAGLGGSHDEREQTLNQILVEMDGFDTNTNVIVVAATNRPDVLDPALLRPGRFDRQVILDRPDMKGRTAILKVHTKGKPLDKTVSVEEVARQSPGFSGADLANLVNEAAILAARRNKKAIGMNEFGEALERIVAGPERKSRVISRRGEADHRLPRGRPRRRAADPAQVRPGGQGHGHQPRHGPRLHAGPARPRTATCSPRPSSRTRSPACSAATSRSGSCSATRPRAPRNDIEKATDLARRMVTEFGMSDKLGPLSFGKRDELVFLGREIGEQRNYSDDVARHDRRGGPRDHRPGVRPGDGGPDDLPRPARHAGREADRRGDRRLAGVRDASSRTCRRSRSGPWASRASSPPAPTAGRAPARPHRLRTPHPSPRNRARHPALAPTLIHVEPRRPRPSRFFLAASPPGGSR